MRPRPWIGFVAQRYFFARRRERNIASAVLSALGIGLGVALLIIVLAVMNGFQAGFIEPIMEISSYHIRLPLNRGANPEEAMSSLRQDRSVASAVRFEDLNVMARGRYGGLAGVNLRIVGEEAFTEDKGFMGALGLAPYADLPLGPNEILMGSELAYSLGLSVGDGVEIISVRMDPEQGLEPQRRKLVLAGIFTSHYYPIDRSWALASLESAGILTSPSGLSLGIKLKNPDLDQAFLRELSPLEGGALEGAVSWREYNRAFFGALRMEKTVMYLVIALIFTVVAVNVFHGMRRSVFERHEEIGLMRGLGASPTEVSLVFVAEGVGIGLAGAFLGLCLGLFLSANVNQLFAWAENAVNSLIDLSNAVAAPASRGSDFALFSPAFFYIEEIPVRIYFVEACLSFLSGALSAVIAAWAASRSVSRFQPQEILRYE